MSAQRVAQASHHGRRLTRAYDVADGCADPATVGARRRRTSHRRRARMAGDVPRRDLQSVDLGQPRRETPLQGGCDELRSCLRIPELTASAARSATSCSSSASWSEKVLDPERADVRRRSRLPVRDEVLSKVDADLPGGSDCEHSCDRRSRGSRPCVRRDRRSPGPAGFRMPPHASSSMPFAADAATISREQSIRARRPCRPRGSRVRSNNVSRNSSISR